MAVFNKSSNLNLKLWLLILCSLAILIVVFTSVLRHDEHYYYVKLNGLKFNNPADTVSIGKDDDIIFDNDAIDSGFLKIRHEKDGFRWATKNIAYIKFNSNINFNRDTLKDGDIIRYKNYSKSLADISAEITNYKYRGWLWKKGQQYFLVGDLFPREQASIINKEEADQQDSKSLLFYDGKVFQIILLDQFTSVVQDGGLKKAVKSGYVKGASLKVEIINTQSSYFISKKEPLFKNRNINYPTVRTEWQSSHLLCKFDSTTRSTAIYFSQPLIISFDKETIDTITSRTLSRTMQITQESSLMDKRTFYFEKFSNLFRLPILSIQRADSAKKEDRIFYGEASGQPINTSFNFEIPSNANTNVTVFGSFLYISPWDLLRPFVALFGFFVVCVAALYCLTNENKLVYSKKLDWLGNGAADVDFTCAGDLGTASNKTFKILRLPVFLLVFILLLFKLVIATKLALTYPFFPQLYFVACFMAFTTPFFITYLLIRNSWAMPGLDKMYIIPRLSNRVFFSACLVVIILGVYVFTWLTIGARFYTNYFDAYNVRRSPLSGIGLYMTLLRNEKSYGIPLIILAIPLALLLYDILVRRWIQSLWKYFSRFKTPTGWVFDVFWSLDALLFLIFGFAFIKSATILHVSVVILFFLGFTELNRPASRRQLSKIGWGVALVFVVGIFKIAPDIGIVVNYFLVIPFAFLLIVIIVFSKAFDDDRHKISRKFVLPVVPFAGALIAVSLMYVIVKPGIGELSRSSRRINAVINRDAALETGGRQYLSDVQFLEIAQINSLENTQNPSFRFVNRQKPFHDFISKGLYPVIINDLNPIVFLDYGGWLFLVIIAFAWFGFYLNRQAIWTADIELYSYNRVFDTNQFNLVQLFRYIPMLIIISNSVWLLLSLFNVVFFTGRVVNGFGVDSIADWFELIAFSALMGMVFFSRSK